MKQNHRIETDTMGEVKVPINAMWGAQTQRSLENFRIGQETFPPIFIRSYLAIKKACATANYECNTLQKDIAEAIKKACDSITEEDIAKHFPLKIWQTGSGTQTNMNLNEVIANIANTSLGSEPGTKKPVHPNDHVNRSQSSNDTFPVAMHISTLMALRDQLYPALEKMINTLTQKATEFKDIVKIGRTHMQDAVPITLGQEFATYHDQLTSAKKRIENTAEELTHIPIGGTAVGTGLNTPPGFAERAAQHLSLYTKLKLSPMDNPAQAMAAHDTFSALAGALTSLASALHKIANDIRLMGSGPRCGLGELLLPENEPGSSIMPGKVNPTQAEALTMVCVQTTGLSAATSTACLSGHLELNVYKPLIIHNTLTSIQLLSDAITSFTENCLIGLQANTKKISDHLTNSLMLVTALTPHIGYENAALIAKTAHKEGLTLKEAAKKLGLIAEEDFEKLVNPVDMTRPKK
ncbi:class II fumarate hydratase [Spirochaetia bacterium 38H-sp]|uniref:Fumarate hydratase class II n=1 Tax=Rarispira pelagica TaxID=3141764 RepID=A0ABU9U8M1_9SPIR